jgi:hypothetical protein
MRLTHFLNQVAAVGERQGQLDRRVQLDRLVLPDLRVQVLLAQQAQLAQQARPVLQLLVPLGQQAKLSDGCYGSNRANRS